jgi:anti-sigma factor RsiW
MKTTIPEQYLTDYALNELGPEERIYVEALLSTSEESREEVCQMIDLAMLLNVGFEQEEDFAEVSLTDAQKRFIGEARQPKMFQRNLAAILAVAACVAVAVINLDGWSPLATLLGKRSAVAVSGAGSVGGGMSVDAAGVETDFVTELLQFPQLARDPLLKQWFASHLRAIAAESAVSFEGMPSMPSMPIDLVP